jgi:hypothetical protein
MRHASGAALIVDSARCNQSGREGVQATRTAPPWCSRCAVTDCNRQLQRVSSRGGPGPYDARIVTIRVMLRQPASHCPPTHMQEVPGSSPGATIRHRNGRPVVSCAPPR